MSKKFNEYRFEGLNYRNFSNKYWMMDRVSENREKIVVKVADCHLFKTRYGWGLILDRTHVVWLKDWAVSANWYGNEVMLDKQYFNVKQWGEHDEFGDLGDDEMTFEHWLDIAEQQQEAQTIVKWEK